MHDLVRINIGDRAGYEVVQLYIRDISGSVKGL